MIHGLESAMKTAMSGNDLLSTADSVQKMAETMLGGKFETVVAMDDFAHKNHFKATAPPQSSTQLIPLYFISGREVVQGGEERAVRTGVAALDTSSTIQPTHSIARYWVLFD